MPGRLAGHRAHDSRDRGQIAREVKRLYPDMPVVLGGWHPSLLPDQTLAAEYVDVVVIGQGEDAFLDVVRQSKRANRSRASPASATRRTAAWCSTRARDCAR